MLWCVNQQHRFAQEGVAAGGRRTGTCSRMTEVESAYGLESVFQPVLCPPTPPSAPVLHPVLYPSARVLYPHLRAPFQRGSVSGNSWPMSGRHKAPNMASTTVCSSTSPSAFGRGVGARVRHGAVGAQNGINQHIVAYVSRRGD